jgi:hypothetical protein
MVSPPEEIRKKSTAPAAKKQSKPCADISGDLFKRHFAAREN